MTPTIYTQPGHQHMLAICGKYALKVDQIRAPSKAHKRARARRELWFRLVILEGFSYPEAARMTRRKHHTTVLYGLRRYCNERFGTSLKATLEEMHAAASNERLAA